MGGTILTDCDGVLWHDDKPIEGSPKTINALLSIGKRVYFVTNNGTKTRQELHDKARKQGFHIKLESIIVPTYSIAEYLSSKNIGDKKVYVYIYIYW